MDLLYPQAVGLGKGGAGAGIDPIYLASYVDFMKAEAYLALGNSTDAATHYEAGMTKSIAKVLKIGFENPKELSYFTLACPYLKYN